LVESIGSWRTLGHVSALSLSGTQQCGRASSTSGKDNEHGRLHLPAHGPVTSMGYVGLCVFLSRALSSTTGSRNLCQLHVCVLQRCYCRPSRAGSTILTAHWHSIVCLSPGS
jgi:hypothetical protein